MTPAYITSRKNPLMMDIRKMLSSRSFRRERGLFVGEGTKLLEEAVRASAPLDTVVAVPGVPLPPLPAGVRLVEVPREVMESVSAMDAPQGALFLCARREAAPPEKLEGERYLVLDGVQDPGNVGTIWRTADALGADGLILVNGCADPWGPKTVRATMGACFRLPVYETGGEELPALLERSSLPLYAAALGDETLDLRQVSLARCAVAIGSEGRGVSPQVLGASQKTVKIPMRPRCESLNAAAAAAVVLWEMARGSGGEKLM